MINFNKYIPVISRFLISLIFIVDGFMKLYNITNTLTAFNSPGVTFAILFSAIITLIELAAAFFFISGHKICASGTVLIGFTLLATLFSLGGLREGDNLIIALQNLAIMGGILYLCQSCNCGTCPPKVKELHRKYHKKLLGLEPFDTPTETTQTHTTEIKQEESVLNTQNIESEQTQTNQQPQA